MNNAEEESLIVIAVENPENHRIDPETFGIERTEEQN
jgi:hypothetical protein